MKPMTAPCKSIVVLGGGTAGWMTAASLAYRLRDLDLDIKLIESPEIATIGVGEATVPAIKQFFSSLNIDIIEILRATNATFKVGISFENWARPNHRFFHPFGRYGVTADEIGFQHIWQMLKDGGENHPLGDYSLATQIAYSNRFGLQKPDAKNDFEIFDWAIHFDANLLAKYLTEFSKSIGVKHIQAKVEDIKLNGQSGNVEQLILNDKQCISGDLFIDCSGIRAIILQGALKTGYNDWRNYLFCDRAIAIGCAHADLESITPYTRARAQDAGWTWRIPLQNRIGNGYVYSSNYISDDAALEKLLSELDGEPLNSPNYVKYVTGHAKKIWNKNCVAIGLSAGFLEPLESTSISLIQLGIEKLIKFWPNANMDERIANEYNRISIAEYERIRDFIILHYKANQREDGKFWQDCREMEIPDTLAAKIDLFKARGEFARFNFESFYDPSWHAMYEGFGINAESLDPMCALIDVAQMKESAKLIREDIKNFASQYPSHAQFIEQNCKAAPKV